MPRLFGTDGVRGVANVNITAELAVDLAVAAAHVLAEAGQFEGKRPCAVVGRDTRISGEFLSAATCAGLASAGIDVIDVGVLPTPAVAYLTKAREADMGVMISASHNPMPDNGIKFFSRGGVKLPDALEEQIESRLREEWQRPTGASVGRITRDKSAGTDYVTHTVSSIDRDLSGLRVVMDTANGAAAMVGPQVLRAAGATVETLHSSPDGLNINDNCGSTHMESLQAAVTVNKADIGVAYDGDADRFLAVDADGELVDGDQIMGILAVALKERGELIDDTLVATVMSNEGLQLAMDSAGITLLRTKVGDRYVLEELGAGGYSLGGEQSGHVVMPKYATTGDGILTSLHVIARMAQTGKSLAELAGQVQRLPQVLINVKGVDKSRADSDEGVKTAVTRAEGKLGDTGRVLLRPSGTEPVVRVMVEAASEEQAQSVCEELAAVVEAELAL